MVMNSGLRRASCVRHSLRVLLSTGIIGLIAIGHVKVDAAPVYLDQLVGSGTDFHVGALRFSDFAIQDASSDAWKQISVAGVGVGNEIGLSFLFGDDGFRTGDLLNQSFDAILSFEVHVDTPVRSLIGSTVALDASASGDAYASVGSEFRNLVPFNGWVDRVVYGTTSDGLFGNQLTASVSFPEEVEKVEVLVFFKIGAFEDGAHATLVSSEHRFVVVPELSSGVTSLFGLVALACGSLVFGRRRLL